jgi:N-dimethylarginine dimethylaminohydrolase
MNQSSTSSPGRTIAFTRELTDAILRCELTHVPREPIDPDRARAQHAKYEDALRALGVDVRRLDAGADMPDAVFIEDTAVCSTSSRSSRALERSRVAGRWCT